MTSAMKHDSGSRSAQTNEMDALAQIGGARQVRPARARSMRASTTRRSLGVATGRLAGRRDQSGARAPARTRPDVAAAVPRQAVSLPARIEQAAMLLLDDGGVAAASVRRISQFCPSMMRCARATSRRTTGMSTGASDSTRWNRGGNQPLDAVPHHQVVFEAEEAARPTGIALASTASAKLMIDAPSPHGGRRRSHIGRRAPTTRSAIRPRRRRRRAGCRCRGLPCSWRS